MSYSYEIGTYTATRLLHNISKVKLKKSHVWFWGTDDDPVFVLPMSSTNWMRRIPDDPDGADDDVEIRAVYDQELLTTIAGVDKITIDEFSNGSQTLPVYVFQSSDDDLPAGYAHANQYSVNQVGKEPDMAP